MSNNKIATTDDQQEKPTELTGLTWGFIIKKFMEFLKSESKQKQERNFKTAFKFFLQATSLTNDSEVGTELTEEFEAKLELYIEFQRVRGVGESTYSPRVSKIRMFKSFVDQNFGPRLQLQTLPKTFGQRLRMLITALGFTIMGFWRTLPKGLLGYNAFHQWCREKQLPSRKLLPIIETIEYHLRVPSGTLRLPQYLRKGHGLGVGQSDSGNKTRAAISKPYSIWTEALEQEFQGLFLNRTLAILPEGEERGEKAQWTRSEDGRVPSAKIAKKILKSFMGFCTLAADCPDPFLRGAGIQLEDLSLALLADKTLVEKFLEFKKLRSGLRVKPIDVSTAASLSPHQISANGLWEYYNKGGKYNGGTIQVLIFVSTLLRPKFGYLYQHPEYAGKLGSRMVAATWDEQCKETRTRIDKIHKNILKMKKEGDIENYEFGRDPKEKIQWILDLPRPLFILQEMIKAILDDLMYEGASQSERARQYRDLILVALLCANPLRIKMFSYMKFDENLIRRSNGSWWLKFGKRAFKNRRALKSDYLVRVAEELWPMLDRYKEEFHPVLVGSSGSKYVFVGSARGMHTKKEGDPMSESSLSSIAQKLTELYIPGMEGFRSHAFRHIIATDIIRKDPRFGFFLASKALHDKLETVETDYIHLKTSEYFEPVNTHFSEAWNLVFNSPG